MRLRIKILLQHLLPLCVLTACSSSAAADLASLLADRAKIERVYYNHRLGEKPSFAQALPQATLENLVRLDLRKEAVLKQVYGVIVTPQMLDAEVQRINTTTRAPEVLNEIKTALGNDPARFAQSFAKPIVVERLLREKFDHDDALHAVQRRQVEETRNALLAAKQKNSGFERLLAELKARHSTGVTETVWHFGPRSEPSAPTADQIEIQKRFGPNAQILSSPSGDGKEMKLYFEDLPADLQHVLRVQLRQPGDVSAVIETDGGFLLYLAKEKTDAAFSAAGLHLSKRSYEQWLEEAAR